ncbi:MAG: BspA family leucine-rich repeat surface protein [Clostridia bacterium]|nr:BspA family leucine-rich repeat surface protein [Clostridia bacterium]
MSKSNRIYKIFMTTMIVAIAGMLLAMGIIAAQKTMKLGVQFSSNPNYKLEVFLNDEETLIFRNFADTSGKTVKMDNGITSLNGDTLIADEEAFKDYGNDFTIIIKNYTKTTGISVEMSSTAKIDSGADGIPAQIEAIKNTASKYDPNTQIADSVSFRIYVNSVFPQTTTLKMTISEYNVYNLSFSGAVTNTPSEMVAGESYTTTITPNPNYKLPEEITVEQDGVVLTEGTDYTWNANTGLLTIHSVSGNIEITCVAIMSAFNITYNMNDVDSPVTAPTKTTYVQGETLSYSALPNKTNGAEFLGWTYTGDNITPLETPTKNITLPNTTTGDLEITANWGATLMAGKIVGGECILLTLRDEFYERTDTNGKTYERVYTSLTSITYGYWDDYKTYVLANSFTNSDSENTLANGIPVDVGGTGSIKLFGNGTNAYILSPNKIFANANAESLCANVYVEGSYSIHHKLESVTIDNLDTSKATSMMSMFKGYPETILDLSSFNTGNVISMSWMFEDCSSLETIYVSDLWSTANVTNSSAMFYGCTKLPNFNSSVVDKTNAHTNSGGYLTLKT